MYTPNRNMAKRTGGPPGKLTGKGGSKRGIGPAKVDRLQQAWLKANRGKRLIDKGNGKAKWPPGDPQSEASALRAPKGTAAGTPPAKPPGDETSDSEVGTPPLKDQMAITDNDDDDYNEMDELPFHGFDSEPETDHNDDNGKPTDIGGALAALSMYSSPSSDEDSPPPAQQSARSYVAIESDSEDEAEVTRTSRVTLSPAGTRFSSRTRSPTGPLTDEESADDDGWFDDGVMDDVWPIESTPKPDGSETSTGERDSDYEGNSMDTEQDSDDAKAANKSARLSAAARKGAATRARRSARISRITRYDNSEVDSPTDSEGEWGSRRKGKGKGRKRSTKAPRKGKSSASPMNSDEEAGTTMQLRARKVLQKQMAEMTDSSEDSDGEQPTQASKTVRAIKKAHAVLKTEPHDFIISIPHKAQPGEKACYLHQCFGDDALTCCEHPPLKGTPDVDSWYIAAHPHELIRFFGGVHSMIHLVGRAPNKDRDDPLFIDWVYLGENGGYVRIPPEYKMPFITTLQKYRVIQGSSYPKTITYGSASICMLTFVRVLEEINCTAVRVQSWGMKLEMPEDLTDWNLAPPHPLADTNQFDIGLLYKGDGITLFKSVNKGTGPYRMDWFPMLTPVSDDYGMYRWTVRTQEGNFQIKCYSRLVHAIKSWNANMGRYIPATVGSMRKKRVAIRGLLHRLKRTPPEHLTGYRIEVTVQSATLEGAREMALRTGFLDIDTWLKPPTDELEPFKLVMKEISIADYLKNAEWLLQRAEERKYFIGRDSTKLTLLQRQVLTDLLSAIGWNNQVGRPPTSAKSEAAWWKDRTVPMSEVQVSDLVAQLERHNEKELFNAIRQHLPCPKGADHRFNTLGGNKTFRATCKQCKLIQNTQLEAEPEGSPELVILDVKPPGCVDVEEVRIRQLPFLPRPGRYEELPVWPPVKATKMLVPARGNCLFAALRMALGDAAPTDGAMRKLLVQEVLTDAFKQQYTRFLEGGDWEAWSQRMSKDGTWGDEFCLYAFRRRFNVPVAVLNYNADTDQWWWHKANETDDGPWLGLYLRGGHYELLLSNT